MEYKVKISGNTKTSDRIKIGIVILVLRIQNAIIFIVKNIVFINPIDPKKILIFRMGSLGDGICALPSINAIRDFYPLCQIDILTKTAYKNLVSIDQLLKKGTLTNVVNYTGDSPLKLISTLKEQKYDLVIELPPNRVGLLQQIRNMLFFRICCIRSGFGWRVSRTNIFKKTQEKYLLFDNEVERLAFIVKNNGINVIPSRFNLNITFDDSQIVDTFLFNNNILKKQYLTVAIGGKLSLQRWPIQHFYDVCLHFSKKYKIIIMGGEEDKKLAERLTQIPNVINSCGFFTPMQSAYCIQNGLIMLSNDSGPLHLSYATGMFTIGIFTARDFKGTWNPPMPSIALRKDNIKCSLCWGNDNCNDNICIQQITPKEVIIEINKHLNLSTQTEFYN